ncbi:YycH family regulatory protein [Virgibacillus senegalensis]|uniref:YycH family regulatory protein n=1 Tax=Virgibacillus senegalensis TaxID=1499679 RepID=UPI00069DFFDF|nr:two-component system activity regulator YycH [Virgibacillus senegalensis]
MKLEMIKTLALTLLIAASLLLTLGIWNYKPNYDDLENTESSYTNEPLQGGQEESRRNIVEPSKIIFSANGSFTSFEDRNQQEAFYREMQEWSLTGLEEGIQTEQDLPDRNTYTAQLIFPLEVPAGAIRDLFSVEENAVGQIQRGSFDRIFVEENRSGTVELLFYNTEAQMSIRADVQNARAADVLEKYADIDDKIAYIEYTGNKGAPIYIPQGEPEINDLTFSVDTFTTTTDLNPLLNSLFTDREVLKSNRIEGGGRSYSDSIRELRAYDNEKYMEYINPIPENRTIEGSELVSQTINFLNAHKGWTNSTNDEYQLYQLNVQRNEVTYRLVYNEYPIFGENDKQATIHITWRNQPYKYDRPLFKFGDAFDYGEPPDLPSGGEIASYLENAKGSGSIKDIALGYKLIDEGISVRLMPAWFKQDNTGWSELDLSEMSGLGEG